jgi:hypothetical protein
VSGVGHLHTIPEPLMWAMILIGFVGLGHAVRRKTVKLAALAA